MTSFADYAPVLDRTPRMAALSPADLTGLATSLGEKILANAIEAGDGSLTWGRGFDLSLQPTADSGLWNGRIGEALLFAALASCTGEERFRNAVERITFPLRSWLRTKSGA